MAARGSVQLREQLVDQFLVSDEALPALGRAGDERDRGDLVPQREQSLGRSGFRVRLMHGKHPHRVGMLLVHPQRRPRKRLPVPVEIRARHADAKPGSRLPHQVRHVQLRRLASLESSEVDVLRGRHDGLAGRRRDRDPRSWGGHVRARHPCRPKDAAPVTRQNLVAGVHVLDRAGSAVGHCDQRPFHEALIGVPDGADVSVLRREQLEQTVLGVVRVLVLVDEDVAERLAPALARLGEALEHVDGEVQHVVEVDGVRREEPAAGTARTPRRRSGRRTTRRARGTPQARRGCSSRARSRSGRRAA